MSLTDDEKSRVLELKNELNVARSLLTLRSPLSKNATQPNRNTSMRLSRRCSKRPNHLAQPNNTGIQNDTDTILV